MQKVDDDDFRIEVNFYVDLKIGRPFHGEREKRTTDWKEGPLRGFGLLGSGRGRCSHPG